MNSLVRLLERVPDLGLTEVEMFALIEELFAVIKEQVEDAEARAKQAADRAAARTAEVEKILEDLGVAAEAAASAERKAQEEKAQEDPSSSQSESATATKADIDAQIQALNREKEALVKAQEKRSEQQVRHTLKLTSQSFCANIFDVQDAERQDARRDKGEEDIPMEQDVNIYVPILGDPEEFKVPVESIKAIRSAFLRLPNESRRSVLAIVSSQDGRKLVLYFLGLLGRQVYLPPQKPENRQVHKVTIKLVEGDIRHKSIWSERMKIAGLPFNLVLCDPPYGLNYHQAHNVVRTMKEWDKKHLSAGELVECLKHLRTTEYLSQEHTLVSFVHPPQYSHYHHELVKAGYANITSFTWIKDWVSPYSGFNRFCSHTTTVIIAFYNHGRRTAGGQHRWHFDLQGEDAVMQVRTLLFSKSQAFSST